MIGISYLGETNARALSPTFVAPVVVGVVGLVLFGRHIRGTSEPFIPPNLIAGRGFGVVNLLNVLYGGGGIGLLALVPLYAVNRYKISTLSSGTLLTAQGVAVVVTASLAAMALRRTGYRRPMYFGAVCLAIGAVGIAMHPPGHSPYLWLVMATCLFGIGTGAFSPAARNAGLQLAPDRSATLAALRSTGLQAGQIATVSITATVIAQAASPGELQAKVFFVFALLFLAGMPVITRVPEHRGSW